ncbi:hypothetical protein C8T65DRAFT_745645 [Cerioporus squamosus]|nr:hypothetical protein C8T65DRAFT_745645 [Cerioporus squamosus]
MKSLKLNCDILLDIIALFDSHQTGLAIMSTCRFLNQEGAKVVLQKQVGLEAEERLVYRISRRWSGDAQVLDPPQSILGCGSPGVQVATAAASPAQVCVAWPQCHPTLLLENFAETLEELSRRRWYVTGEYIPSGKAYPRMRRLVIDSVYCYYSTFILAPLTQAFPNLTHMSVKTCREEDGTFEGRDFSPTMLPAEAHGST